MYLRKCLLPETNRLGFLHGARRTLAIIPRQAHAFQKFRHRLRQRRLQLQRLAGDGMLQLKLPGMQHLTQEYFTAPCGWPPVATIAKQGMPRFGEMHTYLMGTSSGNFNFDKIRIAESFDNLVPCECMLSSSGNGFHQVGSSLPCQKRAELPLRLFHRPGNQSKVNLLNMACGEKL